MSEAATSTRTLLQEERPDIAAALEDPRKQVAGFVGTTRGVCVVLPPVFDDTRRWFADTRQALNLLRCLRGYQRAIADGKAVADDPSIRLEHQPGSRQRRATAIEAAFEL